MNTANRDTISRYVEPIYQFCLKRLNNRVDAEDLSQEILLHVLKGMSRGGIDHVDGWVWRVAHNRYARRINRIHRDREILFGDDSALVEWYGDDYLAELGVQAEHEAVFKALHSLASMYRDILIDFYVHERPMVEIAKKYGISLNTVKWRLYTGRGKIQQRLGDCMANKTYGKIDMHVMCNGGFDPNHYLHTQIHKAIALVAYEKPVTIEEISMATGIPTMYLDEQLESMMYGDAIEKMPDGKCQTDFIILHREENDKLARNFAPMVSILTERLSRILEELTPKLQAIGFYGANFGMEGLGYIVVPYLIRYATLLAQQGNPKIQVGPFPPRKDGGYGWFIVREGDEGLLAYESGCNHYGQPWGDGHAPFLTYYWIGETFSDELNRQLRVLASRHDLLTSGGGLGSDVDEEFLAHLISSNLVCKVGNKYFFNIPLFKIEEFEDFQRIVDPYAGDIAELLGEWIWDIFRRFKTFVPKRLHGQIAQYVSGYTHCFNGFITCELQKVGTLRLPQVGKVFTDNVFAVNRRPNRQL